MAPKVTPIGGGTHRQVQRGKRGEYALGAK